jgi:hypothetical protein
MTSKERIRARLKRALDDLELFKKKVHVLRCITLGDYSAIDYEAPSQGDGLKRRGLKLNDEKFGEILVLDFQEGGTNLVLQNVRTLIKQAAFRMPSIEFEDIPPESGDFNALYLKKRLGSGGNGCSAQDHMTLALIDYIIGGFGWVWSCFDNDKPIVKFVDTLDVIWDTQAKLISEIKWIAVAQTETLAFWLDLFGKDARRVWDWEFQKHRADESDVWMDETKTVIYYFDLEGPEGTYCVLREDLCRGDEKDDADVLEHRANPHQSREDGYPRPYLPVIAEYFMVVPGSKWSVSLVDMMLAQQAALKRADNQVQTALDYCNPYWDVETGAYDEPELKKLESGVAGVVVQRKAGKPPAQWVPGPEIPKTTLEVREIARRELTGMGGADPYASGTTVSGTKYAVEVEAIKEAGSLMANSLALDHAVHWQKVATAFLWMGAEFDLGPLRLKYRGEVLTFDANNPIGKYLRPDGDAVVSEDNTQFASKQTRMALAQSMLQVAIQMSAVAPSSAKVLYERYLRAAGERNIQQHFEQPPMMALPGGADPAAAEAAAADTQQ